MKKTLIALAVLSASGYAMAQSAVSISGVLRIGIKSTGGVTSVTPDQGSGNQVNFNVTEDLGGGLKANARAQLRFDMSNGNNNASTIGQDPTKSTADSNDRLFQVLHVGVGGGFGEVRLGRIGFNQLWGYNPWGSNGAHVNVSATGGATEDGQWMYLSPSIMGLKVEVGGSLSENNKNERSATGTLNASGDNSLAFLVSYNAGPVSATVLTEKVYTGTRTSGFGGSYDAGVAKVNVIWARDKNSAGVRTIDGFSVSGSVPMGATTLKAGFLNGSTGVADKTSLGVDYALSKRTIAEANVYKSKGGSNNVWVGVRHSY